MPRGTRYFLDEGKDLCWVLRSGEGARRARQAGAPSVGALRWLPLGSGKELSGMGEPGNSGVGFGSALP